MTAKSAYHMTFTGLKKTLIMMKQGYGIIFTDGITVIEWAERPEKYRMIF
jgi:hypothetical protein